MSYFDAWLHNTVYASASRTQGLSDEMWHPPTQLQIHLAPSRDLIPVQEMSENALDEDRKICLKADIDDRIAKPVCPDKLPANVMR